MFEVSVDRVSVESGLAQSGFVSSFLAGTGSGILDGAGLGFVSLDFRGASRRKPAGFRVTGS